jgi:UDP-2,3-diacylglucosamine hydrolase
MSGPQAAEASGPVAIICGGGSFPFTVAEAVKRRGRRVIMFPLRGWADAQAVERYPHHWANLGQFGRFVRIARKEGCRDVIFIGSLVRPAIRQLISFDWETLRLLPRVVRQFYGGDNHLLTGVAQIFEDYGFRLLGAHEVAPEILVPEGALGGCAPKERDFSDIARGIAALSAIGPFDVGQAVVVANNNVLAIEAAEGTDHMLARIAELRRSGRIRMPNGIGVLVKAPKPGQDRRFDLPSIGPRTIEEAAQAGLAGIAVIAGGAIVAEPQTVIRAADKAGLFVVGVREQP